MLQTDAPGKTYQWDAEGRMKSINNPSGTCTPTSGKACNTYNALGQRVVHAWPGSEVDWLFHPDGSEMADFMPVPWNDWGNVYFNLNGRPVAKYIGGVGGETFFFHSNAIGSTSMITYYNGDVVQKELFYPYGQTWATGGWVGSYRFASLKELLPYGETGTFMSETRDYPSRLYRWLSPDPENASAFLYPDDPQSWNAYSYALNNPLVHIDPEGLECVKIDSGGWGDDGKGGGCAKAGIGPKGEFIKPTTTETVTAQITNIELTMALAQGVRMAEPGVGVATLGLEIFANIVAPGAMGFAQCVAEGCNDIEWALALVPGSKLGGKFARLNKLHHIFDKPGHGLTGLAQKLGGKEAALVAIEEATTKRVLSKGINGKFIETVSVAGQNVTVSGTVISGEVRLGTAYIKP